MDKDKLPNSTTKAGVLRQLAASFYDGLLLLAIILVATALTVPLTKHGIISAGNPLLKIYLFSICFLYFGWFWVRNGKTLGMRIWHIKLQRFDGQLVSWPQALARFLTALPAWSIILVAQVVMFMRYFEIEQAALLDLMHGISENVLFIIGGIWLVIDHWPGSWRDKLTKTQIVVTE